MAISLKERGIKEKTYRLLCTYLHLNSFFMGCGDYIEAFIPFLASLVSSLSAPIINKKKLQKMFRTEFLLDIPEPAIGMIIQSAQAKGLIKNEGVKYYADVKLAKELDFTVSTEAISLACLNTPKSFKQFVLDKHDYSDQETADIIKSFLDKYDSNSLVSNYKPILSLYIIDKYKKQPGLFPFWFQVITGLMLADLIKYGQLISSSRDLTGLIVFLDAPLVIKLLGFAGTGYKEFYANLVEDIQQLGGKVLVFKHAMDKALAVIKGLNNGERLDSLSDCSRRTDVERSAGKFDCNNLLKYQGVNIVDYPYEGICHVNPINKERFLVLLQNQYSLRSGFVERDNIESLMCDLRSVSLIQSLRGGVASDSLVGERYVLITDNKMLAIASKRYEESNFSRPGAVPCCLTDVVFGAFVWSNDANKFSFANSKRVVEDCKANIGRS